MSVYLDQLVETGQDFTIEVEEFIFISGFTVFYPRLERVINFDNPGEAVLVLPS